ncbi:PLC-like phosphodiesterase [Colletotrichum phormii]|uniref:PLC-like phosphodiesterase n=1 Tax=Colletotrichum phormii TaxID=359342 RepID=A0AAJ0ECS1_9PEZI|nr:PLC-like phosphodiesterase [Colletotrichum phormii]KAK1633923.1 PLC-like phosphodiesterase [Colletotrichum phormii]
MAVAPPTTSQNPLQLELQALQAKHPQYHVVIWATDGGSASLLPGARWIKRDTLSISTNRRNSWNFTYGTHLYDYYVIIEGKFEYHNEKMKATDYSSFVASTAGFDFGTKQSVMRPKPEFQADSWMKHLSDDLCLKDLTLPGTRCSSASIYWINDVGNLEVEPEISDKGLKTRVLDMSKCHRDSIRAQLKSGIRLLDLRCDEERRLRHGPLVLDKQLDDVLDDVKNFLEDNDREVVMVMLSFSSASAVYEAGKPWSEGYRIEYDEVPDHFNREFKKDMKKDKDLYTGKKWPRLGEVRGKVVICRGWDVDAEQDQWGLHCRLPKWEAAHGFTSNIKASALAAHRWNELVGDFGKQDAPKSIVLAACLHHDPADEESWIPPLQTAPILQRKAEEYIRKSTKKTKHLWIYGDEMKKKTNMAIAKLNFLGSDDVDFTRPPPMTVKSAPVLLVAIH